RNADWSIPLGHIEDYFYPLGTNVGYTDSIPLVALLFKLVNAWLPTDFQYLGIWLLACLWLQLWILWRLFAELGVKSPLLRLPLTLLVGMAPLWIHRTMHPALSAHFFLIAAILLYHRQTKESGSKVFWPQLALVTGVAWTHPYLAVMVLAVVMVGWGWTLLGAPTWKKKGLTLSISLLFPGMTLLSWWLIGYFDLSHEQTTIGGLGYYSCNLNSLINPASFSTFLPGLPETTFQYEGYAYLGLGLLGVVGVASILFLRSGLRGEISLQSLSRWGGIGLVALLMWIFALSPRITWGDHEIFNYLSWVEELSLFHTFRSSGRFVWLAWYLIAIAALIRISRWKISQWGLIVGAWIVLLIQFWDLTPLIEKSKLDRRPLPQEVITYSAWEKLFYHAAVIEAYPPFRLFYSLSLKPPYLADLARRLEKAITLGYVARSSTRDLESYLAEATDRLKAGDLLDDHLYLMLGETPSLDSLYRLPGVEIALLDDILIMVSPGSKPELRQALADLRQNRLELPRVSTLSQFLRKYESENVYTALWVHDDATYNLGTYNLEYLKSHGGSMDQLEYRDSYYGLMYAGRVIEQAIGKEVKLFLDVCEGEQIGGIKWPSSIH
ncbi:MAG: DUF6311 domain-containing protein, partial [Bacteroidota bacterium]